jgi:hypothetical protein
MVRKKSLKMVVGIVAIVALAVLAFVAATQFTQTKVPGIGGASPVALELTM